jgi:hypothetical protein
MGSINVVIADEIRAHSKGEICQSTLQTLPSLTGNVSETSSAAIEPVSILPISPTAADVMWSFVYQNISIINNHSQ